MERRHDINVLWSDVIDVGIAFDVDEHIGCGAELLVLITRLEHHVKTSVAITVKISRDSAVPAGHTEGAWAVHWVCEFLTHGGLAWLSTYTVRASFGIWAGMSQRCAHAEGPFLPINAVPSLIHGNRPSTSFISRIELG